jgi:hypothetical protein
MESPPDAAKAPAPAVTFKNVLRSIAYSPVALGGRTKLHQSAISLGDLHTPQEAEVRATEAYALGRNSSKAHAMPARG